MTYILGYCPGQISLPNYYIPSTEIPVDYFPGQFARLEGYQHNYDWLNTTTSPKHGHMPYPYLPNSTLTNQVNSVWSELDLCNWLEGIVLELQWGRHETADGVYNFDFFDMVFDTIRGLKRTTRKKRVLFLLNLRHLDNPGDREKLITDNLEHFIPRYLQTMPSGVNETNYGTAQSPDMKSHYKNTTTYPLYQPAGTVVENAVKFDHVWACMGRYDGSLATNTMKGYNFNLYKFANSAGTNTLKTKFYAFLTALADRYADEELFAGFVGTEAAIGTPLTTIIGSGTPTAYETGNNEAKNYEGRLELCKKIKSLFPTKIMAECANFTKAYYDQLTAAGATNGMIAHKLAFTTANIHIGSNLYLENINGVLKGKVPIMMQVQPLDMRTKTGNQPERFLWEPTPPNYGNPTAKSKLASDGIDGVNWNDAPSPSWLWERIRYFNSNYVIYQRNMTTGGTSTNPYCNWPTWKAFMNDASRRDLPYGGMVGTRPDVL